MIKRLLFAFLAIVVLLAAGVAIASFVAPTEFKVEREVTINKSKNEIFSYVRYLNNGSEWGPWAERDPGMKSEFRGTDGQPGFVHYWKGTNADTGEGEQEIKKITEGQRLDTELRFKQPFESRADAYITTDAVSETQTNVKWGFRGSMPRPMNVMLLVIDMDKEVGKDFEEGLANLKQIMEK